MSGQQQINDFIIAAKIQITYCLLRIYVCTGVYIVLIISTVALALNMN